jgi:hypothetical protein
MRRWLAVLLTLFLCVSLGINVYLWISLKQHNDSAYKPEASYEHRLQHEAAQESKTQLTGNAESFNKKRSTITSSNADGAHVPPNDREDLRSTSRQITQNDIAALTTLLDDGQYALLATELTNYLKNDPLNESLLLLEGELIEMTKPLPTALVHYYDLAELPLSLETLSFIDTKIATLYQQAQTQLSQDEQWELVARLNEPLYQRIPDAKHYTLNLAEAYAYQQKLTLMEDVLAALPLNDRDANIIRDKAY